MKFAIIFLATVLGTVMAAPKTDDSQQQVASEGNLSEALKSDLTSASTRLRTSVNERMTELRQKGDTVKADALKTLKSDLETLEGRLAELNPQTKTGKLIKDRLKERLTSLETTFNEQYAKKDSKSV